MESKPMTPGQYRELHGAVIRALPDMDHDQARAWVDDPGALKAFLTRMNFPLEQALSAAMPFTAPVAKPASASKKPTRIPLPADGKLFQLTLDASLAEPMAMVRGDGYDPTGWKFNGPALKGSQSGQFKLVRLGAVTSLADARAKAHAMSVTLAEGQWREAFKAAYPNNDKAGPLAFGGEATEWVGPDSDRYFPVLREDGRAWGSHFHWAGRDCGDGWCWLVREQVK